MRLHLVDGTYELFRHYHGAPPHQTRAGEEVGATRAVLGSLMGMLEGMLRDRFLADRLGFPANFDLGQLRDILGLALASFMQPKHS